MKTNSKSRFLLCLRNDGEEDLEPRKIYPFLPDEKAAQEGYVRVIDESGEDYLYPSELFVPISLPAAAVRELSMPSGQPVRRIRR